MKNKRGICVAIACMLLLLSATGCKKVQEPTVQGKSPTGPSGSATMIASDVVHVSPEEQWAIDNGLYLDESPDELYQKALAEGGKVVIYTASSRHAKVKADFEAAYPGMELIPYNIQTGELIEKLRTEYEAGIRVVDIVQSKEVSGEYTIDFFHPGILHNYQPQSIYGNVAEEFKRNVSPFFVELSTWFYNDDTYPNGAPIDSWWDLIKPEWNGKVIFQDPLSSPSYLTLITTMTRPDVAEQMAENYKKEFGKEIVLDKDEPNAGYAWINRFLKTDYTLTSVADETVKAIGTVAGTTQVGYSASSKLREKELSMPYIQSDLEHFAPALGVYGLNFVSIVNEAPHPNGAKLYLQYVMGGADGNGAGFQPFNTFGAFPVRPETIPPKGSIDLSAVPLFEIDYEYNLNSMNAVHDYWLIRR